MLWSCEHVIFGPNFYVYCKFASGLGQYMYSLIQQAVHDQAQLINDV